MSAANVYFLGGHSSKKGIFGVLARPQIANEEDEYTRFYTTKDGEWKVMHFDFDINSVIYQEKARQKKEAWWLIGKRGEVVELDKGEFVLDRIDTAGTGPGRLGYLEKIKEIDGVLYICGSRRQVYKQVRKRWNLISEPILLIDSKEMANGFEGIDGSSTDNIVAVGDEGEIWHFDGKTWRQDLSPTSHHLADIKCIGPDNFWICGDGGVVIRGYPGSWSLFEEGDRLTESWWSIEEYQGKVFIAGDNVIGIVGNHKMERATFKPKKNITTGYLHAKDGLLLSVGEEDIFVFNGKCWTELICPDN